jgi:glycosyltransferase involved in cell wall biosynthesis
MTTDESGDFSSAITDPRRLFPIKGAVIRLQVTQHPTEESTGFALEVSHLINAKQAPFGKWIQSLSAAAKGTQATHLDYYSASALTWKAQLMKILLIAYGYKLGGKSESYTAYQLAQTLGSMGHSVTVLTRDTSTSGDNVIRIKNRIPMPKAARKMKLDYFEFIYRAYKIARQLRGGHDLIQHVSPISFRYPDPICNLGIPFIWGPIGGSIPYPAGFDAYSAKEPFFRWLRRFDRLRLRADPLLRNTAEQADKIVVTSTAARNILPDNLHAKVSVIPEAIEPLRVDITGRSAASYLFCSARLVPYKAVDLLLRAFSQCQREGVELWITGDGPERGALERLRRKLGLERSVRMMGRVSKERNIQIMAEARFCIFPALNEAFGHINLEAMMAGKAIIVTDWGGPSDIVEEGITGFKVLGKDPEDHVQLLAQRMSELLKNDELCRSMGERGRERALNLFSWQAVGRRYDELYRSLPGLVR